MIARTRPRRPDEVGRDAGRRQRSQRPEQLGGQREVVEVLALVGRAPCSCSRRPPPASGDRTRPRAAIDARATRGRRRAAGSSARCRGSGGRDARRPGTGSPSSRGAASRSGRARRSRARARGARGAHRAASCATAAGGRWHRTWRRGGARTGAGPRCRARGRRARAAPGPSRGGGRRRRQATIQKSARAETSHASVAGVEPHSAAGAGLGRIASGVTAMDMRSAPAAAASAAPAPTARSSPAAPGPRAAAPAVAARSRRHHCAGRSSRARTPRFAPAARD